MIGIVIVAHGALSEAMIRTACLIVEGELPAVASVAIGGKESPEQIREAIQAAVKSVNQGAGVVILTDMFGGTPTNIALSFLKDNEVEVISGFNLPMLVDTVHNRSGQSLRDVCARLVEAGRDSISLASSYLRNR